MKRIKATLFILVILGIALTPIQAGCLNDYNNDLRQCDYAYCPNGALTCAGCYSDALGGYYGCILQQAIS